MTTVEHADLIAAAGFTVHEFPNGERIYYRDSDHSYTRALNLSGPKITAPQEHRLTAVSTVVKHLYGDSTGLINWHAEQDRQGIAALAAEGLGCDDASEMRKALSFLRDADSIGAALADARLGGDEARDEAGRRGTRTHRHAFEALASGMPVPAFDEFQPGEDGLARAVAGWWLDTDPLPVHSELVVADIELRIAGRFDLSYVDKNGHTVLVDLKTGKPSKTWPAQLSLYAMFYDRCGFGRIDRMEVVMASVDGSYRTLPIERCDADALAAVECYRSSRRLESYMRAVLKEATR
mgnify:FL=1